MRGDGGVSGEEGMGEMQSKGCIGLVEGCGLRDYESVGRSERFGRYV